MCELAEYEQALPVLSKAVRKFEGTPQRADAVFWLARCETAINETNVARWETVMNLHTAQHILAEARYHLARNHPNRVAAMELFVRDFPGHPGSRAFLIEIAAAAQGRNEILKVWDSWQRLVDYHGDSQEARDTLDRLGELNMKLLCSPRPLPFTEHHEVKPGEYISTIAKKHNTSVDSIKRINKLTSDTIRPGVRLKVDKSRSLVKVDVSDHTLTLCRVQPGVTNYVKRYSIGTGRDNNTPRGEFKINVKQKEPKWYKSGSKPVPYGSKENLLGTRWMGIDCPGFGIHGTWEPETIGKASSAGCIRMLNEDVEEVFDIVPFGTPVVIQD